MLLKQTKTELGWGVRSVKVKTAMLNRVFQVDLSKNVIADQRLDGPRSFLREELPKEREQPVQLFGDCINFLSEMGSLRLDLARYIQGAHVSMPSRIEWPRRESSI